MRMLVIVFATIANLVLTGAARKAELKAEMTRPESAIEFSLDSAKREFVVGEPVLLKMGFLNAGQCSERLLAFFGPTEDWFTFRFRDDAGDIYSHSTGVFAEIFGVVRERDGVLLGPDEMRYGYRPVFRGKHPGGGLVVPEPGRYEIWCEFSGWREPLVSDTLTIAVVTPSTRDRTASEFFSAGSAAMLVPCLRK